MAIITGVTKPWPQRPKLAINHMTDLFTLDGGLPPPDMRNEDGSMKELPPMPPMPPVKSAVVIDHNTVQADDAHCVCGGTIGENKAEHLKIVCYDGVGGIQVIGGSYEISDACVSLSMAEAEGMGSNGVSVSDHGSLTVKNSYIYTNGQSAGATGAEEYSVLKVYDSVLISQGSPYGDNAPEGRKVKKSPPAALEMRGNCRTHLSTDHSSTYFYGSTIITDGWAALSTDTSHGYVYLEANDCTVRATKSGYGVYADKFCHVALNRCNVDAASHGLIIDGEADAYFTDCKINCGDYFAMVHCAGGPPSQVGTVFAKNCHIHSAKEAFTIRSENALIDFTGGSLQSDAGVLIKTKVNDDPMSPKAGGRTLFGIRATFRDMSLEGDVLHGDPDRDMTVALDSAVLTGALENVYLTLLSGSRWYATKDSTVILRDCAPDTAQLDAPQGVTISCFAAESGKFSLPSGGLLILEKEETHV